MTERNWQRQPFPSVPSALWIRWHVKLPVSLRHVLRSQLVPRLAK